MAPLNSSTMINSFPFLFWFATIAAIPAAVDALSSPTSTSPSIVSTEAATSPTPPISAAASLVTPQHVATIAGGGVAIIPDFLSPSLLGRMRADAHGLFRDGYFVPDGLTNTALSKTEQGFSQRADRQTFRGGDGWYDPEAGDVTTRDEFARLMAQVRCNLAAPSSPLPVSQTESGHIGTAITGGLDRPTLAPEGSRKHEMTYNWYEPGASLGRHLDEHHEETKGSKGWLVPTRRSVTWLVYLNDDWTDDEGGSLHTFPRRKLARVPVGAHKGDLQVGWIDGVHPVFLDAWRPSGQTALYLLEEDDDDGDNISNNNSPSKQTLISAVDFDVPRQPIEFERFLSAKYQGGGRFEQISTARLDPRFVAVDTDKDKDCVVAAAAATATPSKNTKSAQESHYMDILPTGGTLVLFDSVSLPHSVNTVTGNRQRIAATGWFHEDNQALPTV